MKLRTSTPNWNAELVGNKLMMDDGEEIVLGPRQIHGIDNIVHWNLHPKKERKKK